MPVESVKAGPYVTVLTVSGEVRNGAEPELRARLGDPELGPRSVVVDLTEAVLTESWRLSFLAEEAKRLASEGVRLVVVSDRSLPGVPRFEALDDAMVDLLGDVAKLGDWPPATVAAPAAGAAAGA